MLVFLAKENELTETHMPVNAERIRELVPHSEKMCLLELVLDCNERSILCETSSHLDQDNPLRYRGHLSSICGIEYAAQAMALHAALNSGVQSPPRHGYLASVRDTHSTVRFLDGRDCPLLVRAELEFASGPRVIYTFSIESAGTTLLSGRAAVVLSQT